MVKSKKTVLITGSTSGIGKATALSLAALGWTVIIHGRQAKECQNTAREIITKTQNNRIDFVVADLSDLHSVNQMANTMIEKYPSLNVLINNAGTFSTTRKITSDGLEQTYVVNYLSRFLLVQRLLDTLKQNSPSRIIDISGTYHSKGKIDFNDLTLKNNYSMANANNQSKLANVLFTYKQSRLLDAKEITINTLHPGAVNTGSVLRSNEFSAFIKFIYRLLSIFFKTPKQGATTSVFLATSENLEGQSGKYFENQKEVPSSKMSYDIDLQDKLWNSSFNWLKTNHYL
jgi:NAD(P)-dependent dehydrogenase (short-subunit alcohol dehydrogenase family)